MHLVAYPRRCALVASSSSAFPLLTFSVVFHPPGQEPTPIAYLKVLRKISWHRDIAFAATQGPDNNLTSLINADDSCPYLSDMVDSHRLRALQQTLQLASIVQSTKYK